MDGDGSNNGDESNVDHALLESLFYNEMLLLEDPTFPTDTLPLLASPARPPATPEPVMPESSALPNEIATMNTAVMNGGGVSTALPSAAAPMAAAPAWPGPAAAAPVSQPAAASAAAMPQQPHHPAEVSQVSQERAKQLVSQFATLAERLGISLPETVLSSLTISAARNEAGVPPASPASQPVAAPPPQPNLVTSSTTAAPKMQQQLESTAEAAIAAVSETRKRKQEDDEAAATTTTTTTTAKPLYSKRRKKPRLSDCEAKLAALKEENEMLQRHLATVTNKAQKFDQERDQATEDMKRMLQEGASPEQLNPLLSKFSEMYSDYGRHRHQELTFHLGQLEKLAAPTTFTKMGLWTLGQNEGFYTNPKRNPIAGILRKELGITPVQGRKILEQRQKIRDVCDNLKQCNELIHKLQGICEHKQKVFADRMSKCQEILTPLQVVKLLLWVDEHSHLMESVCPGWSSERIRESSKPSAT